MKLVEFVNAYEQLSVKLGKASIFAAYGKKDHYQRLGRFVFIASFHV